MFFSYPYSIKPLDWIILYLTSVLFLRPTWQEPQLLHFMETLKQRSRRWGSWTLQLPLTQIWADMVPWCNLNKKVTCFDRLRIGSVSYKGCSNLGSCLFCLSIIGVNDLEAYADQGTIVSSDHCILIAVSLFCLFIMIWRAWGCIIEVTSKGKSLGTLMERSSS